MAILKSKKPDSFLGAARQELQELLKPAGPLYGTVSTESVDYLVSGNTDRQMSAFDTLHEVAESIKASFESIGVKSDARGFKAKPTEAQLMAAGLVAMATKDTASARAYMSAATSTSVSSMEGVQVFAASTNPAYQYRDKSKVSLEAFDARNLEDLRAFNVLFAFSAALQDEFSEGFFKTVTLSPDNAGLEISLRRTMVMKEQTHQANGDFATWERHNLLDALTDYTILANNYTRIYPRVIVGDAESEAHFVDKTVIAPHQTLATGGTKITTAPLKIGATHDLVGLGTNDRTRGTLDQTDAIDHSVKIVAVYVSVKTAAGTSIIKVNTKAYAYNTFLKSQQGLERRINLDFPTKAIALTGATTDITGSAATALAFLKAAPYANVQVNLSTQLTGEGNTQQGNIRVNASNVEYAYARIVNGDNDYETIVDQAVIADLKAHFQKIEVIGYDVEANYANLNRREYGMLVDSVEERVRYVVPLGAPISVQTPITATTTATDLAAPMNAQRISNSLNAVTKLLEIRDTLRDVVPQIGYRTPTDAAPEIEGFGRLMVRPYLVDETLNIAGVLTSTSSANRLQDVQAAIVNKLRYVVTNAYTESRYQPALDAYNGTAGERPTVVIGTDPTIASFIMVNGDPRVLGLGFEARVVVSYDARVRGKIFASFIRPNVTDVDIMSFGTFAYIPELATTAQIPYNGEFTNVTTVQNRNLHVCTLPVLAYIEVEGLEAGIVEKAGIVASLQ